MATDPDTFETQLQRAYDRWTGEIPTDVDALGIVRSTRAVRSAGRPGGRGWLAALTRPRTRLAIVAAMVTGVGVIGLLVFPRPLSVVGPGTGSSPSPSPLVWSSASLEQDWPAPVRAETAGRPEVMRIRGFLGPDEHFADPIGDVGSSDYSWIDIIKVRTGGGSITLELAAPLSPDEAERVDRWIAYGLVIDVDRDGAPDLRTGVDNLRGSVRRDQRWNTDGWSTDLATGLTESPLEGSFRFPLTRSDDGSHWTTGGRVGSEATLGGTPRPGRFYAWASVIEGGRVVATDYAPDVGWLDRSYPEGEMPTPLP
jgi:hypothetical protein